MPEEIKNFRVQHVNTIQVNQLIENSMRPTINGKNGNHVIEVKSRCQGIVLDASYDEIDSVRVKLIAVDVPDVVYYDLSGENLQMILQEKYDNLASNVHQNAIVPFSTVGNLPFTDDFYVQVHVTLKEAAVLNFDRIISAYSASSPIVVKKFEDSVDEFESSNYDEAFFFDSIPDVNYTLSGRNVHIPQLLLWNPWKITGVASLKLIPNTLYSLSQGVEKIFLVEWPNV